MYRCCWSWCICCELCINIKVGGSVCPLISLLNLETKKKPQTLCVSVLECWASEDQCIFISSDDSPHIKSTQTSEEKVPQLKKFNMWLMAHCRLEDGSVLHLQVQQGEVLADGNTVLITQEVTTDGEGEAPSGERQESLDPLCCHLEVAHL